MTTLYRWTEWGDGREQIVGKAVARAKELMGGTSTPTNQFTVNVEQCEPDVVMMDGRIPAWKARCEITDEPRSF